MTRANRILGSLIGLILMAAGVIGVLVNRGHLPGTDRNVTLLTEGMSARWNTWDGWATAVVIVAGLVVAAAGIALIRAELRRRGGHSLPEVVMPSTRTDEDVPDTPAVAGQVSVSGRTLRHALQRDLENDPRVKHADVRLTGHTEQPELHLHLDVAANADLSTVHAHVAAAIARFRTTSELQPTLAETTIKIA